MNYGVYYSFDGHRWYFTTVCDTLETAFDAAVRAATQRGARFARVNGKNDVPVWEVSL